MLGSKHGLAIRKEARAGSLEPEFPRQ